MLAENDFPALVVREIRRLIKGIPSEPLRPLTDVQAPDTENWIVNLEAYRDHNWLEAPWFVVETYFYRRILEATGYFQDGTGQEVDPFAYQKRRGLEISHDPILALSERIESLISPGNQDELTLEELLRVDLWGNQADLSIWPAGGQSDPTHRDDSQQQAHMLADDSRTVARFLFERVLPVQRMDLLVDNAGFELVVDLYLALYLLHAGITEKIQLNLKPHPTFVSDATAEDVKDTVGFLANLGDVTTGALAFLLKEALEDGRIETRSHFFWTSPLPMWEMPADLGQDLAQSALILSKGDANYRRLLGDRHWPFTTPFGDITSYMPAPLVALRTLKSEVCSGLAPGQPERISRQDLDWMINGRWGVIQFTGGPGLRSDNRGGTAR
jgi:uncharacterized protein with ATP-grasp and redox domains